MSTESNDPDIIKLPVDDFVSWPSSKFADPIEVDHGIRLAKPIALAAQSWWSLRWLAIIHQFGLGVRLERAKQYAMRGQVLSIEIENGIVKSLVQGADHEPYRVIIAVKTIPKAIWTGILSDLALSSSFGIQVTSGSLPAEEEIARTFADNGALLFPDRQGELQTKCSCLDWSNPCKHIAAVYLLLAAEFEKNPFLIFKLRGLSTADLFALLKGPTSPAQELAPPEATLKGTKAGSAISSSSRSLKLSNSGTKFGAPALRRLPVQDCRSFWKKSLKTAEILDSWSPPSEVASLPESLGEFPFWQGNQEFLPSLRFVYELAPRQATQIMSRFWRAAPQD